MAAGVGGTAIFLLVLKLLLTAAKLSVGRGSPPIPWVPPEYRDGGAEGIPWDAMHGPNDSLDPIATDGTEVYWVSKRDERLMAQAIATGKSRALADGLYNPTGIAVGRDDVYVTCTGGYGRGRKGAVLRVSKTGSTPAELTSALVAVAAPVVHEGALYFVDGLFLDSLEHPERRGAYTRMSSVSLAGGRSGTYLWKGEIVPAIAISETRTLWLPWGAAELHFGPIGHRHLTDPPPWVVHLPPLGPRSALGLTSSRLDGGLDASAGFDAGADGGPSDGGPTAGGPRVVVPDRRRAAAPTDQPTSLALVGETVFVAMTNREGISVIYRVDPDEDQAAIMLVTDSRIRELQADQQRLWWVEEGAEPFDVNLCAAPVAGDQSSTATNAPGAAAPSATAAAAPSTRESASIAPAAPPPGAAAPHCAWAVAGVTVESFLVAEHLPRGTHIALAPSRIYWTTGRGVAWVAK